MKTLPSFAHNAFAIGAVLVSLLAGAVEASVQADVAVGLKITDNPVKRSLFTGQSLPIALNSFASGSPRKVLHFTSHGMKFGLELTETSYFFGKELGDPVEGNRIYSGRSLVVTHPDGTEERIMTPFARVTKYAK